MATHVQKKSRNLFNRTTHNVFGGSSDDPLLFLLSNNYHPELGAKTLRDDLIAFVEQHIGKK
jgi:hypothetical protein